MSERPRDWRPGAGLLQLQARARILADIRAFFAERGVLEVQTAALAGHTVTDPAIESLAVALPDGGRRFLQTSPEYQMKRLLAAGTGPIYQIGPVFRAGESGRLHNTEFTLLEWYRPDFDDTALMGEVAELVSRVLGAADHEIHRYASLVGNLDRPRDELDLALVNALDGLRDRRVFIVDYPADQAALARLHALDPTVAARFEFVVNGVELANGYHELGDADQLRARFEQDNRRRAQAALPAIALDEPFLTAMTHGLPDCSGVALGVDRLVMLATGASSIDQVMAFSDSRV